MKKIIALSFAALLLSSCGKKATKASDPLADSGRTQRTEFLLSNLKQLSASSYLFGHQDSPVYGIGWEAEENRSDINDVCNDFPALYGFDLGHIERGDSLNLDGVPFSAMREQIIRHYDRGGVSTISWHLDNPVTGGTAWIDNDDPDEARAVSAILPGGEEHENFLAWLDIVADFLNSLETPYGVRVPVIFRPWHENNGNWFWWGADYCTPEQYRALWQMTLARLKERNVSNCLFAYSPNTKGLPTREAYLSRYPGDEMIDILGFDHYCRAEEGDADALRDYATTLSEALAVVSDLAKERGKVAAVTETGYEAIPNDDWWTQTLAPALDGYQPAYVLLWRNAHNRPNHYFAPFPGQRSAPDFVKFYNLPQTLFRQDLPALYSDPTPIPAEAS